MKTPPFLSAGDGIRIISPSGKIDPVFIDQAALRLSNWGFNVSIGEAAKGSYGRFGGTVAERLQDISDAYLDTNVKAILCSRGGYGVMQLLDKIDPQWVIQHPKWLIGYSDITAMHAFLQTNGIASIHAPMARHLAEEDDRSSQSLHNMLIGKEVRYSFDADPFNREGEATGILRGGNLSMLMALRGTPYDIVPQGTLLFIEDIAEQPYHVERMLLNLKHGGVLSKLSGLIVGQFTGYEEDASMMRSLKEIIADTVAEYHYPVAFNFPVGHVTYNLPLICGATVQLKIGKNPQLSFSNSQ